MSIHSDQTIVLAKGLLDWSQGEGIGFTSQELWSARELAMTMLRALARSLTPSSAEAAWLLVLWSTDGEERALNYARAVVRDWPDAQDWEQSCKDMPGLREAVARERASFNADRD